MHESSSCVIRSVWRKRHTSTNSKARFNWKWSILQCLLSWDISVDGRHSCVYVWIYVWMHTQVCVCVTIQKLTFISLFIPLFSTYNYSVNLTDRHNAFYLYIFHWVLHPFYIKLFGLFVGFFSVFSSFYFYYYLIYSKEL